MSTTETPSADSYEIPTADEWKNVLHDPILPSGRRVVYRDVSLGELVTLDALPDDLRLIAIAEYTRPGSAVDMAAKPLLDLPKKPTKKQREKADSDAQAVCEQILQVNRHLIALALVEPRMTVDDLAEIPYPDLEMLGGLVNRKIAHDAVGRRVGVVPLDWFRIALHAHGVECAPGCETCQEAGWLVSTLRR